MGGFDLVFRGGTEFNGSLLPGSACLDAPAQSQARSQAQTPSKCYSTMLGAEVTLPWGVLVGGAVGSLVNFSKQCYCFARWFCCLYAPLICVRGDSRGARQAAPAGAEKVADAQFALGERLERVCSFCTVPPRLCVSIPSALFMLVPRFPLFPGRGQGCRREPLGQPLARRGACDDGGGGPKQRDSGGGGGGSGGSGGSGGGGGGGGSTRERA